VSLSLSLSKWPCRVHARRKSWSLSLSLCVCVCSGHHWRYDGFRCVFNWTGRPKYVQAECKVRVCIFFNCKDFTHFLYFQSTVALSNGRSQVPRYRRAGKFSENIIRYKKAFENNVTLSILDQTWRFGWHRQYPEGTPQNCFQTYPSALVIVFVFFLNATTNSHFNFPSSLQLW
jgi:hypothetical protein